MEYRIACPRRGGEIRHQVKPRWRDPAFLAELEREIRLAAFDLLLYHLEDAHPEGPEDLRRNADARQLQPTRRALLPRREKHVWLRPSGDGPVTVGIDDVAQSLAGPIVSCPPKKAGRAVPKGQSVATIEASKWVGPGPAPVTGETVEVNEVVKRDPGLLSGDPYGEGWLVRLKPSSRDAEQAGLVTGPAGLEAYHAFLESQGLQCRPAGG